MTAPDTPARALLREIAASRALPGIDGRIEAVLEAPDAIWLARIEAEKEVTALRARVARLEDALRPLAARWSGGSPVFDSELRLVRLGALRAASEALGDCPEGQSPPLAGAEGAPVLSKFTLFWRYGEAEVIEGTNPGDAFRRAGIGAGAMPALDVWERGDRRGSRVWDSESREWRPAETGAESKPTSTAEGGEDA